jgi:Tfp pilus assembly protein FimT
MKLEVSKTNEDLTFFNQRLDEIQMSSHQRLMAKARFARAEAVADALSVATQAMARLFKRLTAKPTHPSSPAAPSAG